MLLFSLSLNAYATDDGKPLKLIEQDHPLVGKIWDVSKQQYLTKDQLLEKVLISDYVLLGETHDNIKHHQETKVQTMITVSANLLQEGIFSKLRRNLLDLLLLLEQPLRPLFPLHIQQVPPIRYQLQIYFLNYVQFQPFVL